MSEQGEVDSAGDFDSELAALTEEITRRLESGDPVSADDCFGDNPACAEPIRRLLPAMRQMVSLGAQIAHEQGSRARLKSKKHKPAT